MPYRYLNQQETIAARERRWHQDQPIGYGPDGQLFWTNGRTSHRRDMTNVLGLPKDLTGKRVLEIGTSEGAIAFECERRGASEVLGCDVLLETGFVQVKAFLNSKVRFLFSDCQKPDEIMYREKWDLIVFCGVIYHLPNPFSALKNIRSAIKDDGLVICTSEIDPQTKTDYPTWSFWPGHSGDPTNFWYPTDAALAATAKLFAFEPTKIFDQEGRRSTYYFKPI